MRGEYGARDRDEMIVKPETFQIVESLVNEFNHGVALKTLEDEFFES